MIHLLPSRANLDGFFPAREEGLVGFAGFFTAPAVELVEEGAIPAVLRAGFLWFISLLSTLRSPLVTSSPLLSSANTAAGLGAAEDGTAGAGVAAGGGGGGGGGYRHNV